MEVVRGAIGDLMVKLVLTIQTLKIMVNKWSWLWRFNGSSITKMVFIWYGIYNSSNGLLTFSGGGILAVFTDQSDKVDFVVPMGDLTQEHEDIQAQFSYVTGKRLFT